MLEFHFLTQLSACAFLFQANDGRASPSPGDVPPAGAGGADVRRWWQVSADVALRPSAVQLDHARLRSPRCQWRARSLPELPERAHEDVKRRAHPRRARTAQRPSPNVQPAAPAVNALISLE